MPQHLFQCRIAWEYAFRFRDFPILAVQSFYNICRIHNASDIIRKLKKELTSSQLFSQLLIAYGYFFPHFSFMFSSSVKAAVSFGALYTSLKSEENFFRSLSIPSQNLLVSFAPTVMLRISLYPSTVTPRTTYAARLRILPSSRTL